MLFGCTLQPDIKETKLGSSNIEAFPSACKNTEIILVSCPTWKCVSTAISGGVDIFDVSWCHLLQWMSYQWGLQKLILGLVSELEEMAILSKVRKPEHLEWHNSLKLSFTNIWGFHSNFDGCELSFRQTLLTFLLYKRQT